MTVHPPSVWQISAGPASRSYADVFLKCGVALLDPGDAGRWKAEREDGEFDGGLVRRFACEIADGDIVLMRTGIAKISAVGLVVGDYDYFNAFDDVNGWDLQHARRVRWHPLPEEYAFPPAIFGANPPRCSRVWTEEALDFAARFLSSPPTRWQTAELPSLPTEDPPLDDVPESIASLVAQAADLVPMFQNRRAFGEPPSEDELIVHFVVPLLRALGWPPERVAMKWRCIDVALFRALPRSAETCCMVIEAKRLGAGVEGALEQAKGYVEALGVPKNVIVTDGIRYRMYEAQRDFKPIAYANLARLKRPAADLFARLKRP